MSKVKKKPLKETLPRFRVGLSTPQDISEVDHHNNKQNRDLNKKKKNRRRNKIAAASRKNNG